MPWDFSQGFLYYRLALAAGSRILNLCYTPLVTQIPDRCPVSWDLFVLRFVCNTIKLTGELDPGCSCVVVVLQFVCNVFKALYCAFD